MGISKQVKDLIRARYPQTIRNCRTFPEFIVSQEPPVGPDFQPPQVVCFDYTAKLKYYPAERVSTGHEYMTEWFLPPVMEAYANGARTAYICFDRGSPINKDLEHQKRYKNIEFMAVPESEGEYIINDGRIPSSAEWEGFVNNKQLVGELIHYITQRLMDPQLDPAFTFTPPAGKVLAIHGGRAIRPNREIIPIPMAATEVLFVESVVEDGSSSRTGLGAGGRVVRRTGVHTGYPGQELEYLLEAELACLYFARHHDTENCLFVTPDGDMLLQLLLMAADRIDPTTGNFRNCHYLQLTLDSHSDYVDINALYTAILTDPWLRHYQNPVLSFVAVACMLKNDYIHGFCPGIQTCPAQPPLSTIFPDLNPAVVFQVLYSEENDSPFARMITCTPNIRGNTNMATIVHIDEALWEHFVHALYVVKYRTRASKKFDLAEEGMVTINHVRDLLHDYKNTANRVMAKDLIRRFGRQLLWVLEYWLNNYRNTCRVYPPHSLYKNKSYYGWFINAATECLPAPEVSEERPDETRSINRMFKRRWHELEHSSSEEEEEEEGDNNEKKKSKELPSSKKQRRFHVDEVVRRPHRSTLKVSQPVKPLLAQADAAKK